MNIYTTFFVTQDKELEKIDPYDFDELSRLLNDYASESEYVFITRGESIQEAYEHAHTQLHDLIDNSVKFVASYTVGDGHIIRMQSELLEYETLIP